ncbi:Rqc2 family fibronectin-binding protein [Synechocystis sp. PCC 7509]|uniref:Rqc2 family fibronectin-binding protein n=1 Tax=Synechocystis sp. PCC 7509 TaxID=927677 RepID=UPI0002AC334F|nr:NFACT family protein [Synechocystis sp. PCC 7509]
MQPVDLTTLIASTCEIRTLWLPARTEQVYQRNRFTIAIALRTLNQRGWLEICWHPQAAHFCMGSPPPRSPDTFTFSQQLIHQLNGLALVALEEVAPWERVIDLQFARRPGESALWHLYVEIMGKYSNVILTDASNVIVTAAHQVSQQQSSVRPIQTGQTYELPPSLSGTVPSVKEENSRWIERVNLVPGPIGRCLLKSYRGLSPALVQSMVRAADLDPEQSTTSLEPADWQRLFSRWLEWLQNLEKLQFFPGWTAKGYTVMGWEVTKPVANTQELLDFYYTQELNQQEFIQLRNQLLQKLSNILEKLRLKARTFTERLQQSEGADVYRQQADLLMANLPAWQLGMKEIVLLDFDTSQPVTIGLEPEKNAVQNAQKLYKQVGKLKRARGAVEPLLNDVQGEIDYLEQVENAISQIDKYQSIADLDALYEIREELIGQKILEGLQYLRPTSKTDTTPNFHRFRTPSGFEVLIGRNNQQNDRLTFRLANDYDLWFHAQEIPGAHVLLRLEPGAVAEDRDLQFTADLAAYYSRSRQSDRVPVVYTQPKHVYKPKGAKPGIAIYKQERILWGKPSNFNPVISNL